MNDLAIGLTPAHIIYVAGVILILATAACRKDMLIMCIAFIFLLGAVINENIMGGIQAIFDSAVYAGIKFMDIIVTISFVSALSACLSELGSDYLLMSPGRKIMRTPAMSFWVLGITMFAFSLFLWPSPAVALVGAILVPIAVKSGLKPLGAAIAMNVFGHGFALSYDFVIQGAPSITAEAAGIQTSDILLKGRLLFIVMGIVTTVAAYFLNRKNMIAKPEVAAVPDAAREKRSFSKAAVVIAVITPILFALDIVAMVVFGLKGGDATSLVSGTAVVIMCIGAIMAHGKDSLEKVTDYIRHGFKFGIKIFAPVIIIGAFFLIGGDGIAEIFPAMKNVPVSGSLMNDWAIWLSQNVPLQKNVTAFMQLVLGAITGLDGSGFSGLPLVGSLAQTFGNAIQVDTAVLATLGQLSAIWVGGGVIIPWALIPVAAICGIEPQEVARANFMPVMIGFAVTLVVSFFLL